MSSKFGVYAWSSIFLTQIIKLQLNKLYRRSKCFLSIFQQFVFTFFTVQFLFIYFIIFPFNCFNFLKHFTKSLKFARAYISKVPPFDRLLNSVSKTIIFRVYTSPWTNLDERDDISLYMDGQKFSFSSQDPVFDRWLP